MDRLQARTKQSGAALDIAELQISPSAGLVDISQPSPSTRKQLLERVAAAGITAETAGTSYFGLEAWAEPRERQMRRLNRTRMLTIRPTPFDSPQLASSVSVYLSSTSVILSPGEDAVAASAWSEPASWLSAAKTPAAAGAAAKVKLLPWTGSTESGATLSDLLSRASTTIHVRSLDMAMHDTAPCAAAKNPA